jgi:hypothetical protein
MGVGNDARVQAGTSSRTRWLPAAQKGSTMARRIGIVLLVVLAMGAAAAPSQPTSSTSSTTTSPTTTTSLTTTTSTSSTTSAPTTTATTTPAPTTPDCDDVLTGGEQGSLGKSLVGGDEQAAFEVFRIQTDRPAGVYHVVDCIRAPQPGPPSKPAIITTVDLGEVHISGAATFRVDIPGSALPGEEICDRFVVSGHVGGVPFADISNQVCTIHSGCLGFGPGTCPPGPSTTGGVAPTTPRDGTLPFTGSATWPLLLTAVALLGLGVASLVAARWHDHRPTL